MIEWDYPFLYENYKSIRSTLYFDGYLLPYYIGVLDIPSEYNYTHSEWGEILKKGTDKIRENLISMSKNRRKDEILILNNKHRKYEDVNVYHLDELKQFIRKYPQYKNIVEKL